MTAVPPPSASRHAAFLRNVNLGRPGSPDRGGFEAAFLEAGAARASAFLVNGTLVFDTPAGMRPRALAGRACALLSERCGLREPVFVRSVGALAALAAEDPFAGRALAGGDTHCISFVAASRVALPALPFPNPRGDVELLAATGGEVLSLSRRLGASAGSPNALLEKLLGVPATTRSWRTVVRLIEKFA